MLKFLDMKVKWHGQGNYMKVKICGMNGLASSQGMHMKYIKATPLLVQKLWYKLKLLEMQFKVHKVIDFGATCKGFIVHYACRIWSVYILLFKSYDKGSSLFIFFLQFHCAGIKI